MARGKDLVAIAKVYDVSGIVGRRPSETVEALRHLNCVACSDLSRSLESAHALGFVGLPAADRLFREAALPHFASGSMVLPVTVWMMVYRLLWLACFSRNGESYTVAKARTGQAANRLIGLAKTHGKVVRVGHGLMNYLIAQQLCANGCQGTAKSGKRFWAFGIYGCGGDSGGQFESVKR